MSERWEQSRLINPKRRKKKPLKPASNPGGPKPIQPDNAPPINDPQPKPKAG